MTNIFLQSRTNKNNNPRYHIRIVSSSGSLELPFPRFNDYATPTKETFCERVILPRLDAYITFELGVDEEGRSRVPRQSIQSRPIFLANNRGRERTGSPFIISFLIFLSQFQEFDRGWTWSCNCVSDDRAIHLNAASTPDGHMTGHILEENMIDSLEDELTFGNFSLWLLSGGRRLRWR